MPEEEQVSPLLLQLVVATHSGSLSNTLLCRNRVRHVDEHFDLDLTYITDRIIGKCWW